jgi:pimeloyl-ACP methyl ester carboxylesterase
MSTKGTYDGWEIREAGPANAPRTVLLLPGALCSGEFYEDVFAEPALASHRLVAATVPGFGRTKAPDDLTIENYAHLAGKLAADLDADVLVGHSYGANIALEAAALGTFSGSIVLLSPSFSRKDEATALGVIDKLSVLGSWVYKVAISGAASMTKKASPAARRDALMADISNNDPGFCRRSVHEYFSYLDRYKTVAPRLCQSGVKSWVVFGDHDEIGLQDHERSVLEACATVTLATVPGTHMFLVESPAQTAAVIAEAAAASLARTSRILHER